YRFSIVCLSFLFFFFNDTPTTDIYTLSLHDALPILLRTWPVRLLAMKLTLSVKSFQVPATPGTLAWPPKFPSVPTSRATRVTSEDRKSTRLNSSHVAISYAVFCLKKKNKK